MDEDDSILKAVAFEVLEDTAKNYNGKFTDEILESLYSLFGVSFYKATELLDQANIILYQTPHASRKLFKLTTRNMQYSVFPNINFCNCPAFRNHVLESETLVTCKHVLAVALAQITQKFKREVVTDLQFVEILNDNVHCN